MASNILSRLIAPHDGNLSVYETLQQQDELSDQSDIEDRAGMAIDEENLDHDFHGYELNDVLTDVTDSRLVTPAMNKPKPSHQYEKRSTRSPESRRQPSQAPLTDEADDEVPQSLLIEDHGDLAGPSVRKQHTRAIPSPAHGTSTKSIRTKWRPAQAQRLKDDIPVIEHHQARPPRLSTVFGLTNPKENALWRWANVENLDNFLKDVTLAFVVGFSVFLTTCIDYKNVRSSHTMSEILIPKCTKNMSGTASLLTWVFLFLWIGKLFEYIIDLRRLRHMQNFYLYLLEIPDADVQTVSWQEVVKRLMSLRDLNPTTAGGVTERHRKFMGSQSKQRIDAHDIANRLMRRENYLIALINKDILDLTLPVPFLRGRQLFSKTLEWNLSLCILDFVFNEQGQVRPLFLKDSHRRALSDSLQRRFRFAGFMNVVCAPFIIIYFVTLYFFRYFNEYQKNPSQIGSRQYTPLAEWKFREFNELWHLFQRRINMSYPFASRYIDQFPKDKTIQLTSFIGFVAGALASVLFIVSVVDPELFLGFEITPDRTVLFYLGIFTTVWAVARGAVPEENIVFDPEFALRNVIDYTHYLPSHWRGRLHSDEVRSDFAFLYQMKVVIFLEEILSIIFTPFVLWFSLPKCSDRLVDFFREFTVHVDGLGYVCSFAVFDFKKGANNLSLEDAGANRDLRDEYYSTKDGKMLASYYGFVDNYVTNQRPGAPFLRPLNRRQLHTPPLNPGLPYSPTLAAEYNRSTDRFGEYRNRPIGQVKPHSSSTKPISVHRTPQLEPLAAHSSPMASILLDPQNQPSSTVPKPSNRLGTQLRLRVPREPLEYPVEDDEDALAGHERHPGGLGSESGADTSGLGDSWKTTRAGAVDDDSQEEELAITRDQGPGVLGLVYQFSKAQTQGRGTGVTI
ncbi:MAG: hypothetical protein LQ342_007624 [Letrouitia transgressa]|nr:MAG: hypothetical protein LQ342_007624 [Letrouitia transgressa]